MSRHPISFVLAALVLCGASLAARRAEAITFGEPDSDNRFSNVGAVVVITDPNLPFIAGSAVLVHPRVLLTAGHVTALAEELIDGGIPAIELSRISFGVNALDPSSWVEIEAYITHPDFAFLPYARSQDIGAIILKEPIDLPSATLADEGLLDDLKAAGVLRDEGVPEQFLAIGYGATLEFPPPRDEEGGGLRRFSFSDFRALEPNWLVLNQNPATGNGGTGFGDSGGPRFWLAPDGKLVLVGLTSRGDPQLVSLDLAYRIDTADGLGFIDFVIDLVEGESVRRD